MGPILRKPPGSSGLGLHPETRDSSQRCLVQHIEMPQLNLHFARQDWGRSGDDDRHPEDCRNRPGLAPALRVATFQRRPSGSCGVTRLAARTVVAPLTCAGSG